VQDLKQQLEADIRKAFINYENSLALSELEERNFEIAEENYEIAQDRYNIGNATALEIREAQVNFVQAELRKLQAAFNVQVQEVELKRLAGENLR
jgi:outer membrane protein TolC